jgi:hypothetical protein
MYNTNIWHFGRPDLRPLLVLQDMKICGTLFSSSFRAAVHDVALAQSFRVSKSLLLQLRKLYFLLQILTNAV